jgi:hypothetical protein
MRPRAAACAAVVTLFTSPLLAQGVPSAGQDAARSADEHKAAPPPPSGNAPAPGRAAPQGPEFPVHPWTLPAIDVVGEPLPELVEEDRVGSYEQPRWSTNRRFPTTRMYVIPAGKAEAEYWMRWTGPLDAFTAQREVRNYYEMGFGLGHRLQLDVYLVTQQEGKGENAPIELKREQVEIRYALADWGKLWGNPTLYLEYQRRSGENDWIEPKILIGGGIAPGWHGAFNLVLERELGGNAENEWDLTGGISRTIVDQVFHVGVEAYAEVHDRRGDRFKFGQGERLFLAGPSFLWHPVAPMHLLISPLFGEGSPGGGESMRAAARLWFVAGWTF